MIETLTHLHSSVLTEPIMPIVLLGDFSINLTHKDTEQKALKVFWITTCGCTQLINQCTTYYRAQIGPDR